MAVDGEDDAVVRELDVYICNEFQGSATQVCLFQHPLRPPWRPYNYEQVKNVRMKKESKRLEVDLPLDTEAPSYNEVIEDYKKVKHVTLRSTLCEAKTTHAIGCFKDGKLLLAPIDYSLQLRPSLTHLNIAAASKKKDEDTSDEEEDEAKLHALEVTVQKRETERQQQQRLNSYAYISQREEEEEWKTLALHTEDSQAADAIWNRFMVPKDVAAPPTVPAQSYLKEVVPASTGPAATGEAAAAAAAASTASTANNTLSEPAKKALQPAVVNLLREHSVCTMGNIRTWLEKSPLAGAAKEAAFLTDRALHEAIMAVGNIVSIRRLYMQLKVGDDKVDPIRSILIDLLKDKESFKKSEVQELSNPKKLTWNDTLFVKVARDICVSKGNSWMLKAGAENI